MGTVIDKKSGAPVPGVMVRVIVRQDRIAEVPQASTTTDAQGHYRLDGLHWNHYVEPPGRKR